MLTTTRPLRPAHFLALWIRLRWPRCKAPIVGTKATGVPVRCQWRARRCMAAMVLMIRTAKPLGKTRALAMQFFVEFDMGRFEVKLLQ